MGWKGTFRTLNAAARKAERNAKKRQRELEKRRKQLAKMQEIEQAAYEVEVYENHIEVIQSMHKECSASIDWNEIAVSSEPAKPTFSNKLEAEALKNKESYRPSLLDKLFNRTEKKNQKLINSIATAKKKDEESFERETKEWNESVKDWNESVATSQKVLAGDPEEKMRVIKDLNPFSELDSLGSGLAIAIRDNSLVEITIKVHGKDIIPSEQKGLLKSGKLSVKKMPVGKFNEIYQDYVCSAVLRIANEFFSIFPDEFVQVNAEDEMLNKSTGHIEVQTILSARIARKTISGLNMDLIDPSDSMENFVHNMSFKKTQGFSAVERVETEVAC